MSSSSQPTRSASVGALPRERRHTTSRAESSSAAVLDVRCACQYFQCDSLLPDRINPVDSRPGSSAGFAPDVNIIQLARPGLHHASNRSFVVAKPPPPPDPERMSTRSFAMGQNRPVSFDQVSTRNFGIERQPAFDQVSNRGLVVRSISDVDEDEMATLAWQNKPASDRISVRSYGSHTHISRRDADTISMRSVGLKRISRSPSQCDLYIAEIDVPSLRGSRRGSKIELPQLNIIAPTPIMEVRSPFGDHHQALAEASTYNKENKIFSAYDERVTSKYKPPEQFAFLLEYTTPVKQLKVLESETPQLEKKTPDDAGNQTKYPDFSAAISQRIVQVHELQLQESSHIVDISENQKEILKPLSFDTTSRTPRELVPKPEEASPPSSNFMKTDQSDKESFSKALNVAKEIANLAPKMKAMAENIMHIGDKKGHVEELRFRAEDLPQYQTTLKEECGGEITSSISKTRYEPEVTEEMEAIYSEKGEYNDQEKYLVPVVDKKIREPPPPPEEWSTPPKPYNVIDESSHFPIFSAFSQPPADVQQIFTGNQPQQNKLPLISCPILDINEPEKQTLSFESNKQPSNELPSDSQQIKSIAALVKTTEKIMSYTTKSVDPEPELPFRADDLPQYSTLKSNKYSSATLPRAASETGSQRQLDEKIMRSNLLKRKQYFTRTQSQDRAPNYRGSVSDIRTNRMMKTVSFDFEQPSEAEIDGEGLLQDSSNMGRRAQKSRPKIPYDRNHEYEPIGLPSDGVQTQEHTNVEKEPSPIPTFEISEPPTSPTSEKEEEIASLTSIEKELAHEENEHVPSVLEQQREIEERYFSSVPTTPRTDSRTDNEIHTSQVDSSAIEELPLKTENRKKSFMASAQDRSRRMTQNIRSQAGKIKTRIRGPKKASSGSPKPKEKKRFKKPDFSKIKMPEMKRPELPKFKAPEMPKFKPPEFKRPEFKRPEFTKFEKPIFTKPDLSRFKIPDTMTLKLRRSKSLRETEPATATTETTSESPVTPVAAASPKKRFEFNFGTYPRMLKKRKQKLSTIVIAKADDLPSTETPPSVESTTLPRQVGGPVSPRWNEKSSEVSYGDSESGKYQRYESVMGSLGRESSLERRIKEELERSARKQEELELLESIEQKQFADYDEENRAIHEISKIRENEFKKRRPIMHQDSDLVSEESKDVGWSDKDVIRNAMLRGAEESDVEMMQKTEKYPSEEVVGSPTVNTSHETQSTASSGIRQKGVIEEIDDDEFILRKRGISQDNIEIRQYISSAIREGLTTPINTLAQLGSKDSYYPDMDVSNEDVNYGYDVPPPKPKRANKFLNDFDSARDTESRELSQEFEAERRGSFEDNTSLPHSGENYFANMPPSRPTRRSRRKHYPREEDHQVPSENIAYLDDEEDNALFKKMNIDSYKQHQVQASHEDHGEHNEEHIERYQTNPPKAPKRRKKQLRDSVDKDSYANRFAGRSVSNSFLPSEERDEDFIVYRTQHEYIIPLAQAETFSTPTPAPRRSRSRSQSRITDDDRTSHGAESLASESFPLVENKFHIDMKETDGYATVRKDPPPRPPAPTRQRKGSPLLNQHFSTMPHKKRSVSSTERLKRNFHTMGPSRPPRRRSSASMGDSKKDVSSPDVTQYEELDIDDVRDEQDRENRVESPRGDLHSGDVINKMKYRPLPPPPRPPRESRKKGRRDYSDHFDDRDNKDDGAERITCDLQLNGDYNVEKHTEKCIEVEVSTQTDPLPDDFVCEEFEITEDMRVIEPRVGRTLQDILKQEEQSTDQQEHEDDSLIKSLQRFREASQRSYSERSRASTADRSRASHGSRPATPSVVVIERRIPTPIPNRQGETMLEASLFVMPLDDAEYDDEEETEDEVPKEDFEHVNEATTRTMQQEEEERLTKDQLEHKSLHHTPINGKQELSEEEEDEIPPPIAPPRKRSSVTAEVSPLIDDDVLPSRTAFISARTDIEPLNEQDVERSSPFPTRLTLAELEVERLSVNELQAANITVSQLQSSIVRTDELECRSSNVAQPLEITENLIEEIVRRVRSAEKEKESDTAGTQPMEPHRPEPGESPTVPTTFESPPPRPPPPQIQLQGPQHPSIFPSEYMQYSVPPPSFYTLRDPSEAEPHHSPPHRRRRHHRRRDSSSEEDSHREHHRSRHSTRSPEPTIGQLGAQFLQACGSSFMRSVSHIVNILRANTKEGNDRNISTAIVLVILVTIGFLLLGITGNKNIHHHHWDYFNPPDHKGRE